MGAETLSIKHIIPGGNIFVLCTSACRVICFLRVCVGKVDIYFVHIGSQREKERKRRRDREGEGERHSPPLQEAILTLFFGDLAVRDMLLYLVFSLNRPTCGPHDVESVAFLS